MVRFLHLHDPGVGPDSTRLRSCHGTAHIVPLRGVRDHSLPPGPDRVTGAAEARPSGPGDGAQEPENGGPTDAAAGPRRDAPRRTRVRDRSAGATPPAERTRVPSEREPEPDVETAGRLRVMMLDPGAEHAGYAHDLANALTERGSDVELFTAPAWRESAGRCHTRRYKVRIAFSRWSGRSSADGSPPARGLRSVAGALGRLWSLARLLPETRRHDVVHFVTATDRLADLLWIWLVGWWATVVSTVHAGLPPERRGSGRTRAIRERALRAADVLFVPSRETGRGLERDFHIPSEKIVHVRRGRLTHLLDLDERPPPCPISHGRAPVILLLADRITGHSGADVLLRAANHLRRSLWDFRVVIAGEPGMDLTPLQDLVRDLGLERSVEFRLGRIDDDQLPAYLRQATVLVFPHRHLGRRDLPVAGCTFGKAMVGVRANGLEELVDEADNGIVVPPDAPRALADALVRVLRDDDLRRRYETNSLIYARTDLSWRRLAGDTVTAYRRTVNGEVPDEESGGEG